MRLLRFVSAGLLLAHAGGAATDAAREFSQTVRPVLAEHCGSCHNPANPKNRVDFLKSETVQEMEARRGMWHDVAIQLRNRTMPPVATKLTEEDRLRISAWIDGRLRETACSAGDYAGYVPVRRLNRREYHNTIRDLLGVEMPVTDLFPADEAAGSGFDTNGDTLYIPPILLERYMEAARKALDRAIITPPLNRVFPSAELQPAITKGPKPGRMMAPKEELSATLPVFVDGPYSLRVSIERPHDKPVEMSVKVDGITAGMLAYARDPAGGPTARIQVAALDRGVHTVTVVNGADPVEFFSLTVEQKQQEGPLDKRALHYRLFGMEPGESPFEPRRAARRILARVLPRAFRQPVSDTDLDRFMALYDRAAERGDPYEERLKLALQAVLVSPRFLFHVEETSAKPGIRPLGQYEVASRLSYFLWSTMPDEESLQLAAQGRLQDSNVLAKQVERMLDDPRSRAFASAFVGQWLGTQDVGGRVVPLLTELQHYYTPEIAADLREQPALTFHHMIAENRSLLDLIAGNYTFLNERLAKFYQVDGKVSGVTGDDFRLVNWPDDKRAGVLGLAPVLAMTSHYKQGSPVLRGAWILDTLLGTPVPAPPPDVPPLETAAKSEVGKSMKQILARHRVNPSCAACHNLMDPIGFALENFDWMGRWRDQDANGAVIDASGALPSGEKFNGPVELRNVLLGRKDEFLRHISGKVLGYAIGRAIQDGDQCTIQRIVETIGKEKFGARALVREVVLSVPFRNSQGGLPQVSSTPAKPKRVRAPLLGEK